MIDNRIPRESLGAHERLFADYAALHKKYVICLDAFRQMIKYRMRGEKAVQLAEKTLEKIS